MTVLTSHYSGALQGDLWGARALDWADYQEVQLHELYTAALGAVPKIVGQRLLDAGCGSGALLRRAAKHGATVTGLDASRAMVAITRHRVPDAEVSVGELETLPYNAQSFDIVTGINSFPHATDPVSALAEARRVLRPGGRLVAVAWGPPEQCDAARHLEAVEPLLPPLPGALPGPFALAKAGALTDLAEAAGFSEVREQTVASTWDYADLSTLLRGLLSAGPMVRAIAFSGTHAVSAAVLQAVAPYRTSGGGYRLHNVFRMVVATA